MKYLGVCIDEFLEWAFHINQISQRLVKANTMLCKIRYFVNETTLRSIYVIFHSHLSYVFTVWVKVLNKTIDRVYCKKRLLEFVGNRAKGRISKRTFLTP